MKSLLGLKYLTSDEIREFLDRAKAILEDISEGKKIAGSLEGLSVLNLFLENSTRTRVSFELAEKTLGMNAVNFSEEGSSFGKGESLLDTVKNLEAMKFDFYVVRHPSPGVPGLISRVTGKSVINAGDGACEHPTQALLDMLTLENKFKKLNGLRVCIVGDISHSRVAMSNIFGLQKMGALVSVCGPVPFIPRDIEALGVKVCHNIDEAISENQAINILRVQLERDAGRLLPSLNEYNKYYGINMKRFESNPRLMILHPGPMNINVEIDYESSVAKNSLIFSQVTAGLAVRIAAFQLLAKEKA